MIDRYTLLSLLTFSGSTVFAQPTLTAVDNVGAPGQIFPVNTVDNYVNAGPAGASQVYHYWDLLSPSTGLRNISYHNASVSPASASIPTATLLSTDGGTDTLFWKVSALGLEQVGSKTAFEGVLNFTDASVEMKLPITFGGEWSDATGANYSVSGIPAVRTGTITGIADAYGTLEMPWEVVFPEVLRVKVRRDIFDNSAVINTHRIANIHYYYIPTQRHPVLKLVQDSVQLGTGAWTTAKSAQWTGNPVGVGVDEINADDFVFSAYPNPANDLLNFSFASATGAANRIEIMNAVGQVVLVRSITGDRGSMDTRGLGAGLYTVRAMNGDRLLGTRRLVIE